MKKRVFIVLGIFVFIILSITIIGIKQHFKNKIKYDFQIITSETSNCSGVYDLIYELPGKKDLYAYCLDSIKVSSDNSEIQTLSEFIKENGSSIMNNIYSYMNETETLEDGTKIYLSDKKDKFTNNGLKIIACSSSEGNNDIFIGSLSMDSSIVCK